jgi:hypothetical protein
MWAYVAVNIASQLLCIVGVYRLQSQSDPLTVNVVLTVRKFVSLMLSIVAFGNTFTAFHWVGAVCVFGGAVLYGQQPPAAAVPALPAAAKSPVRSRFRAGGAAAAAAAGSSSDEEVAAASKPAKPRQRSTSRPAGAAAAPGGAVASDAQTRRRSTRSDASSGAAPAGRAARGVSAVGDGGKRAGRR